MDAHNCRVCGRTATRNLDPSPPVDEPGTGLPLCDGHAAMVYEALREAARLQRSERSLGFGQTYEAATPEQLVPLTCDRSTWHTWTGRAGDPCYFCVSLYVDVLHETRTRLLATPEVEQDDKRYGEVVVSRARQLLRAAEIGLLTAREVENALDRWSAHV